MKKIYQTPEILIMLWDKADDIKNTSLNFDGFDIDASLLD